MVDQVGGSSMALHYWALMCDCSRVFGGRPVLAHGQRESAANSSVARLASQRTARNAHATRPT
jgi:hypothetical protein